MQYDDGGVALDDAGIVIRRYCFPWGSKRIPYGSIREVRRKELGAVRGKWRLWGSGDFRHWWNLDTHRPSKEAALELDTGHRVIPTITPDDVDAVERILHDHLS